jgi:hypothetical protein
MYALEIGRPVYSAVSSSSCARGGESMATAIQISVNLDHLVASRKHEFTFPVFAVGSVLTTFLTIILNVTVSASIIYKYMILPVKIQRLSPVIWAAGAITTVTTIVVSVSVPAIILAGREITAAATARRRRASTAARRAASSWSTFTLTT